MSSVPGCPRPEARQYWERVGQDPSKCFCFFSRQLGQENVDRLSLRKRKIQSNWVTVCVCMCREGHGIKTVDTTVHCSLQVSKPLGVATEDEVRTGSFLSLWLLISFLKAFFFPHQHYLLFYPLPDANIFF